MHVSLDGFVCGPNGEMDWIKLSDDLWDHVKSVTDRADAALYGAVTYKMMESYWPTAAQQPDATQHDIDHASWVNNVQKIVFSKQDIPISWEHTTVIHSNIAEEMRKLRELPGKDMLMIGSPTLAHSFMELNLIDEFYINLNPVVIGSGKPLFKNAKIDLELVSSKEFSTGVIGLHYKVVQ